MASCARLALATGGDDFDSLMGDLQAKVFGKLPDETWF